MRFRCEVCNAERVKRRPVQSVCAPSEGPSCRTIQLRRQRAAEHARRKKPPKGRPVAVDRYGHLAPEMERRYRAGESGQRIARALRGETKLSEITVLKILRERGVPVRAARRPKIIT